MEKEEVKQEVKSDSTSMIASANVAADRLEKANAETARLLNTLQEIEAIKRLGGRSDGAPQVVKPKEETPEEYANKFLRGE